jgi:peptidoglycan/xylan/chitin deacetylase (PgdA/CDA1 family)
MTFRIPTIFLALTLLCGSILAHSHMDQSHTGQHLNVLMYHHIADDTPASTSTRVEVFQAHLDYLAEHHTVVDLVWALERLQAGESIPDNAVALTFDDAYINVYTTAWPMLEAANFPFTVFVATQPVDQGSRLSIQWDQLREMHAAGVRLLNHSHDHDYMVRSEAYDEAWRESVIANITHAQNRLTEELGTEPPKVFAYPFGEYNNLLQEILADLGYIAMGQHSGGIAEFSDWFGLPRFAAGGTAQNLDTLRVKLQSKPLPVAFPLPDQVTNDRQPVLETAILANDQVRWQQLNCFTGAGRVIPFTLTDNQLRVQTDEPFEDGRNRYNCTAPAVGGGFYWLSQQWLINQGPADY